MLSVHMDEWLSGQPDVRCVSDDFITTIVYMGTCESKADSTFLVSRSLYLKRHFMGLGLTSVLPFSCTPERGESVCHAHGKCVIVVEHCHLHNVLS